MQQPAESQPSGSSEGSGLPGLSSSPWRTIANGLTGLRLLAAPVSAFAILEGADVTAGLCFGLAVATDLADGRVARRRGEVSPLGGLLDHSTDALFVSLGLAALAFHGVVPPLLPILVASAFVQYVLDSKTLAGHPLRGSWLGRWNGIAYFVLLGVPVIRDMLGLDWPADGLVQGLGWVLVVSTLASMLNRGIALARVSSRSR